MKIVVLAGGKGSRLWPLSTEQTPKPFLALGKEKSLLQKTLMRLLSAYKPSDIVVITSDASYQTLKEQCLEMDPREEIHLLVEKGPRGTTAAFASSLVFLEEELGIDPLEPILLTPSDAFIEDVESFIQAVALAEKAGAAGFLALLGSRPTRAEGGYGYIEYARSSSRLLPVTRFIEKPGEEKAREFLLEGNVLWNMGHLVVTSKTFWEEIAAHLPEVAPFRNKGILFETLPDIPLDYSLLEKSKKLLVVEVSGRWSDLGSWDSLSEIYPQDDFGNSILGGVELLDVKNSFFVSQERKIAAIGVEDLLVIDSKDALFIGRKGCSQRIKELTQEAPIPSLVKRPWGFYTVLESGLGYKVKKIVVEPGHRLSLQMHEYRSEHWVVVQGSALVEKGEESFFLEEKQTVFIPPQTMHRLTNLSQEQLVVIEVQAGAVLEEEDIIRFQDDYARELLEV